MRHLGIAALALALALASCGGGEEEPAGRGMETDPAQEPAAGKKLFSQQGCGSCHTLAAAGSDGVAGPKLDESLEDDDAASIRESIVDPRAFIVPGFAGTTMPGTGPDAEIASRRITDEEVDQIVAFLLTTREN